jgi:hypothetical protein
MTASELVTAQIEAYNRRDLKGNIDLFSDNFQTIQFSDRTVLIDGKKASENMFRDLFNNSPNLRAEIIHRIDYGNKVIVHEIIHGRNGSNESIEQLLMFEIIENKIERIYRF